MDKRDWAKYNEHLVHRREFDLSLDFIAGWIKVHVVIDRKTRNILSMEVSNETVQDETCCTPLIDSAQDPLQSGTIKTVLVDGAYDHRSIFNDLEG